MGKTFYILAEQPGDGVYSAETLCKFGRTKGAISQRRNDHELAMAKRGRCVQLEKYFAATGSIAGKERHIKRQTRKEEWMTDIFDEDKDTEWRECHPRDLAELAMDIGDNGAGTYEVRFFRTSRHEDGSGAVELPLGVRIPRAIHRFLRERCRETGSSKEELVTEALDDYLVE